MATLDTERLILRPWKYSDFEPFAEMSADQKVMEYFPSILDRKEAISLAERIQNEINEDGYGFWACELKRTHQFMGFIGIRSPRVQLPFSPCVEIGWRLAQRFWGQGFAVEGARKCLNYGFQELGLSEIVSFTYEGNFKSRRVMEKLGMIRDFQFDFDHPKVEDGHWLRPHVLYRIQADKFAN